MNLTEPTKEELVRQILQAIDPNPQREGLQDTPARVVRSWLEMFGGHQMEASLKLTTFDAEGSDEIVLLKNIEFYSTCEHHMLPFSGIAHVAYIPTTTIVGISKLARVVDVFGRRLQNQERITMQVTRLLEEKLEPRGVACILEAKHHCMQCRGVGKQNSKMVTSSMRGVFKDDATARNELMQLIAL